MTVLDEIAGERRIRCGDVVRHRPSDEEWLVAYADYESGYLSWAGWPEGRALIAECDLINARDDERHLADVRTWLATTHSADHRSAAVRRLYPEAVAEIERLDRAAQETPMPADLMPLSRAEIISLRYASSIERGHVMIRRPHGSIDRYDALLNMAERSLDEPARLASARAEGVREGIEMAASKLLTIFERIDREITEAVGRKHYITASQCEAQAQAVAHALASVRNLSPPPAEPTGMTADGWIAWIGGECPVPGCTIVEAQHRNGECSSPRPAHEVDWDRYPLPRNAWDVVAYRIVKPAEPSAPVAEGE